MTYLESIYIFHLEAPSNNYGAVILPAPNPCKLYDWILQLEYFSISISLKIILTTKLHM